MTEQEYTNTILKDLESLFFNSIDFVEARKRYNSTPTEQTEREMKAAESSYLAKYKYVTDIYSRKTDKSEAEKALLKFAYINQLLLYADA